MNRVDYLSTRINQLAFRGWPRLFAQWLARLELGESPAGQCRRGSPGNPGESSSPGVQKLVSEFAAFRIPKRL
jgi:hypothetical protein